MLLATIEGSNTTYHHRDHLSIRVNTNSSGTAVGSQGNYPWGEAWYTTSTTTKWRFTTYERDNESGLDYAMFRYDSSRLGRFLTPDPVAGSIGNPQSLNRYAYVRNDPVNLTDPLGLCPPGCICPSYWEGRGYYLKDPWCHYDQYFRPGIGPGIGPGEHGGGRGGKKPEQKQQNIDWQFLCQPDVLKAIGDAWGYAQTDKLERTWAFDRTEEGLDVRQGRGTTPGRAPIDIYPSTIASIHTHPVGWKRTPAEHDTDLHRSKNIPFYVVSPGGIYVTDPNEKKGYRPVATDPGQLKEDCKKRGF